MFIIHEILFFFLLFPSIASSNDINVYNLSLGIPLNVTDIELHSVYIFNIEVNYPKILRIKAITDFSLELGKYSEIYMKEHKELDEYYFIGISAFYQTSKKYNSDNSIRYLFSYDIRKPDTNFCSFEYLCNKGHDYFYIVVDLAESYDLPIGNTKTLYNVSEFFDNYFFIIGVERFQRMNVTMTVKGKNKHPFSNIYISEYAYRTEEFRNYKLRNSPNVYSYETISEDEYIYAFNFIYDIERYPTVVLSLRFLCDLYYLNLTVEAAGGEFSFHDNYGTKNLTNLKANYPYFFFSNIAQYQTILITLITKYYENLPFYNVKIYEYKNKSNPVDKILKETIITNPIFNNEKLNISFSYQMNSLDITDIGFQFIPNFDLDYLFAKIAIIGGVYYLNDEDIKHIYNIYPGYEMSFWIKSSQYDTININLKYIFSEENPLNNLYIYEYNAPLDNNKYYKIIKHEIIPEKNNDEYFTFFSYIVDNSGTKYVLLKINPIKFLECLEIKVYTHKKEYDLINSTPIRINIINPGNIFYFFINATIYNQLFIEFTFNAENKDSIKYITINEYEKRKDLLPIKSTNLTFEIIKNGNESVIKLIYKPISFYSKYLAFILEANSDFDYLITKVDIGGGYYEFYRDKNITKLIAGSVYSFITKISPIQKIEMKIFIDDDISISPFTYANIYEKEKKENNSFSQY